MLTSKFDLDDILYTFYLTTEHYNTVCYMHPNDEPMEVKLFGIEDFWHTAFTGVAK